MGTDAGFAVALINRKLKGTVVPASHIEAAKDGEEPIAFGPTSFLSDFGDGWKLQTVTLTDFSSGTYIRLFVSSKVFLEKFFLHVLS